MTMGRSGLIGRFTESASWNRGLENTRALRKWVFLGVTIGIVAGLGAVVFFTALEWATKLLISGIAGYTPPKAAGEGETVVTAIQHRWLIPVVTTLGALIGNLLVFRFAPEAEGHGTDAAIDSFHHKGGVMRARVPPIKLIASAITIGSGGSGGREGPAAQISAGFGSLLATWLRLDTRDRRIAVAVGMGAGIGAIFRAPLGGAVMAAEILYLHDLEVEALIPSLIASITGYSIFGAFEGWSPVFGNQTALAFTQPAQLLYYVIIGGVCGLVGLLYAHSFHGFRHAFHRLPIPNWVKPGIGGLAVGLLGMVIPEALHTGYGWVQLSMTSAIFTLPLWIILVLPFAKIIFTSFSIGSGGSGGIFGPGMVTGGMVGAAIWRLAEGHLPGLPVTPAPFVIVAMMALFGSPAVSMNASEPVRQCAVSVAGAGRTSRDHTSPALSSSGDSPGPPSVRCSTPSPPLLPRHRGRATAPVRLPASSQCRSPLRPVARRRTPPRRVPAIRR